MGWALFQSRGIGLRIESAIDNSCSVFTFVRNPKIRRPFEDYPLFKFENILEVQKLYSMHSIISKSVVNKKITFFT